jgi:hypothetical protein
MKPAFDPPQFDPGRLAPSILAAYVPYLAGAEDEAVLLIGTRAGIPHLLRRYEIADFADDGVCEAIATEWADSGADTVTAVVRTCSPYLANRIAERCYSDGVLPEPLTRTGRGIWLYGNRFWKRCDTNAASGTGLSRPEFIDIGLARTWAIGVHAALANAQSTSGSVDVAGAPDFRRLPDGAHLAECCDLPLVEWLLDTELPHPRLAGILADELHLTAEPTHRTAGAVDWILGAPTGEAACGDFWTHIGRCSTGTSRANALALAALAAWRWDDPAASALAAAATHADPHWRLAREIAAVIEFGPNLGPKLFSRWVSGTRALHDAIGAPWPISAKTPDCQRRDRSSRRIEARSEAAQRTGERART